MLPRITYVLRTFPELTETFVFREIRALQRRGVPVTVLAIDRGAGGAGTDGEVEVRYLALPFPSLPAPMPLLRDLRGLPGVRRRGRAVRLAWLARGAAPCVPRDTAVLHAHFANDAGALARYTAALTGIPYRLTAHAYDLYQDPFLLAENLRAADRVFTVSGDNLAWLRTHAARHGWDPGRAAVLHCGLPLAEHPYRDPAPPGTPARIVCVARLVEKKGHDVLLAAVRRLAGEGLRLRVDLVGDGPARAEVEAAASGLDVRLHGAVRPEGVRDLVRGADVLALAARVARDGDRDGLPVALIEAAALGVPIVATAVSGIPELVDETTGHLASPGDPQAFAAALRTSLQAPAAERIGRARRARERVEAEFDVDRLVEVLVPRAQPSRSPVDPG